MGKRKGFRLGDLQLRIMKVLWERGSASVAEVAEGLGPNSGLAYTTVATMLRKMEARGMVEHHAEGRRFIYRAKIAEREVTRSMTGDVLERLFEGSLADMVSHILQTREVGPDELDELEQLIATRRKRT